MTEDDGPARRADDDGTSAFDELLARLAEPAEPGDLLAEHPACPPRGAFPRRHGLTVVVAAMALAGVIAVGAGVAGVLAPDASSAAGVATPEPSAASAVTSAPPAEPVTPVAVPTAGSSTSIADLVDPRWVAEVSARSGIPERALSAYAGAAISLSRTQPGCGLGWNTLAAIGLVESDHGANGGSQLAEDGVVRPRIVGAALNGDGLAAVADTDRGALDGDTTWDHAVGPMQFIPATWAAFASDGDGDGIASVDQIDDAALTAARYLCAGGGDLTVPSNWIAAIAAYNPDVAYNNRVAEAADAYGVSG